MCELILIMKVVASGRLRPLGYDALRKSKANPEEAPKLKQGHKPPY